VLDLFPDLRLRAGAAGIDGKVLWVHVIDQPDMGHWLRDGTFVLTTGIGWGAGDAAHRAGVRDLAAAGAAALLVATGRFLPEVPATALSEAEELGLPLIEAPFSMPFIDITSAIQRLLVGEQYEVLEQADHIHRELTQAALTSRSLGQLLGHLAEALGCDPVEAAARLEGVRPERGRLAVVPAGRLRLLDDTFNAAPLSMLAALETLGLLAPPGARAAVLGDMLELGPATVSGHRRVGRAAAEAQLAWLVAVGPLAEDIAAGALEAGCDPASVHRAPDAEAAAALLPELLASLPDGAAVLFKASHATGLDRLVAAVEAWS
jgi:hypothetical protein